MKRSWAGAVGALLVLAVLPAAASAQGRTCEQVLPSDARRLINAAGHEMVYFRDPVRVLCTGGIRIEADSAVMNRTGGTLVLVGRVVYVDGEHRLTADWANYLGRTDDLFARGQVVLTDLTAGSVVTGDDFEYRRQTRDRPESRMIVRGRRPHAVLRAVTESPAADTAAPTQVWASRMEFVGESVFLARTDVELERGDMRGGGEHARFDQLAERMTLIGDAHVESDEYRLDADTIDAFLEGDALRHVAADRDARLRSDDLTVHAQRIRIGFVDGELDRMQAWNRTTADEGGDAPRRALAMAEDFHLRADSIDARADRGRLQEMRAVGRAYGERQGDLYARAVPEIVARDWIQGDTIIGYFGEERPDRLGPLPEPLGVPLDDADLPAEDTDTAAPAGAEEDASPRMVLERVEVIGGSSDALSLYRIEPAEGHSEPAINFMRARRIVLFMIEGEVSRVEAEGPLDGLYLDPVRAPAAPDATPPRSGAGP